MDGQHTPGVLERAIRWYFVPGPKPWQESLSIVASSLFMLFGVLVLRWEVFAIMFLYWAENVILGGFTVLRMAAAGKGGCGKLFTIPFFCIHYGGFCFAHGIFLILIFGAGGTIDQTHPLYPVVTALFSLNLLGVLIGMLAYAPWIGIGLTLIFLQQGVSFFHQYVLSDAYRTADVDELFGAPYGRIIKLHFALLIGGFLVMLTGSGTFVMCLMILGKLLYDLRTSWQKHAASPAPVVTPATHAATPPIIATASVEEQPAHKRKLRRRRKKTRR
ncbi:MAG: DUF6498-containing protein [Armatimonadota bacterium]